MKFPLKERKVEEAENMTGTFEHALDTKSRLFMPARLREEIGDVFHLAMGSDPCLTIYPQAAWDALCQRADELEDEEDRETMEIFFAGAFRCVLDSQSRFVVPATLREYAELEKDVVIVGANSVARIWSADRWAARVAAKMTPERMKALNRKVRL